MDLEVMFCICSYPLMSDAAYPFLLRCAPMNVLSQVQGDPLVVEGFLEGVRENNYPSWHFPFWHSCIGRGGKGIGLSSYVSQHKDKHII